MRSTLTCLTLLVTSVAAWSPTGGYAPGKTTCPSGSLLRTAEGLSLSEELWVQQRNAVTDKYLADFLELAGMTDFDVESFLSNTTDGRSIKVGLAFSGGGYRAMTCGAGQLAALDSRIANADSQGLGGLLQASTYISGLSGGSWLVGTVAINNYLSVEELIATNEIWQLENTILNYGGWNIFKGIKYWTDIFSDISSKLFAGFEVTITDLWGRALSHQFFTSKVAYGNSAVWSQLQTMEAFSTYQMPFPILVAIGRAPGSIIINGNSTIFEFNAFEMGSWDPSVYLFTQTEYLGTKVKNGVAQGDCIGGFDNAGFVMGTSSSLFNYLLVELDSAVPYLLRGIVTPLLNLVFGNFDADIALYEPNPFEGNTIGVSTSVAKSDELYLVDGGEDGQNIPLYPILQADRDVDVVFAYDNSADTDDNYPDGASLVASFQRQFWQQGNGTLFPYVPDTDTFLSEGLTQQPTFFGCSAAALKPLLKEGQDEDDIYKSPLIVYTANREFSYDSGKSTYKLSYSNEERDAMIQNGFEVASRNNRTLDSEFAACVGCAIVRREQERQGIEQSEQCQLCFSKYCWSEPDPITASTVSDPQAFFTSMTFHVPTTTDLGAALAVATAVGSGATGSAFPTTITASSVAALVSEAIASETSVTSQISESAAALGIEIGFTLNL